MRTNAAMSLIEILVVIAIIAILAAILMPVAGIVRGSAATLQCQGNMRELGMAMITVGNERKRYPKAVDMKATQASGWSRLGGWDIVLLDYSDGELLKSLACPIHPSPPKGAATSIYSGTRYPAGTRSYAIAGAMNGGWAGVSAGGTSLRQLTFSWATWGCVPNAWDSEDSTRPAQVQDSSGTLMLAERAIRSNNANEFTPGLYWTQMEQPGDLADRHRRRSTAVFADGHCELITAASSVGSGNIGTPAVTAKGAWTIAAGD